MLHCQVGFPSSVDRALGAVVMGQVGTGSTSPWDGNLTMQPLPTESKQGQQGHREAEEEALGAGVPAPAHVPQHGLQGAQPQWQGQCPPQSCSAAVPRQTRLPSHVAAVVSGSGVDFSSGEPSNSKRGLSLVVCTGSQVPLTSALSHSPQVDWQLTQPP